MSTRKAEGYQVSFAFAGRMLVFLIGLFPTTACVEDWLNARERQDRVA